MELISQYETMLLPIAKPFNFFFFLLLGKKKAQKSTALQYCGVGRTPTCRVTAFS